MSGASPAPFARPFAECGRRHHLNPFPRRTSCDGDMNGSIENDAFVAFAKSREERFPIPCRVSGKRVVTDRDCEHLKSSNADHVCTPLLTISIRIVDGKPLEYLSG
jgi:hypothetical protein